MPPPPCPFPARADELFLEQVQNDPEVAAYIRANPEAAVALGLSPPAGQHAAARAPRPSAGGQRLPVPSYPSSRPSPGGGRITGFGNSPTKSEGGDVVGGDFLGTMAAVGTDMRRKLDSLAARFRRGQSGASTMPWATSASTAGRGSAPAPSSGGGGASTGGLGARLTSMFDGRGQYATLSTNVDGEGGSGGGPMASYTDDVDGPVTTGGRRGTEVELTHAGGGGGRGGAGSDGRGSGRGERVAQMSGSPAPAAFGRAPPMGGARPPPASIGSDALVEIDFTLNDFEPGAGAGGTAGASRAGARGAPSRTAANAFSIEDDEEEADTAALSRLGGGKRHV